MSKITTYPFYIRLAFTLISVICISYIFFIGKDVIIPVLMAFLFAVLLLPVSNFLTTKVHLPHILAVSLTVLLFILIIIAIFTFISYQISDIASDFDRIKKNIELFTRDVHRYISATFNLSIWEQKKYIDDVTQDSMKNGTKTIGNTLISVTDIIADLTLIPIYTFLILLYRTHFILFFAKLVKKQHHPKLKEILSQVKSAINNYIVGLIIETIVVSVLTGLGLYIIGVKYFILLGIITGILNLIPYVGILIAGLVTVLSSLTATPDISIMLGILIINIVVQIIDNNILVPMIINTKVEINAFVSIIGIIIGGGIAGISGMFLAIPLLAILKIIFDRIESLEPWGYLLGDNMPKTFVWRYANPVERERPSIIIFDNENNAIDSDLDLDSK
ncbi:putative PurR-regulated permease PerM [Flavobacterium sp. 7E]|uniref:AI-2E family transporter n=1 Tax=Flavobacterium sp. 7E TaxID=2735898 RepID=UPI001570CF2F|nr:AI-2E family transporter [Flavobacterium sp. 7E]NRS90561.1 putative PurR-regulated permease PerM [Flavobacterium sp. 7E]